MVPCFHPLRPSISSIRRKRGLLTACSTENPDASLEKYKEAAAAVEEASAPEAPPGDAAGGGDAGAGGDSAGGDGAGDGGSEGGDGSAEGAAGQGGQLAAGVGLKVPAALLAAAMGAAALF